MCIIEQNPLKVSQYKQKSTAYWHVLESYVALYNGIEIFCQCLQDEFNTIEKDGLKLTIGIQKTYASQNKYNRKTKKT